MARKISAGLAKRIKAVKLLILDVDGVMTDGGIIYDDDGRESKVVYHRAKNLGIDMVYQGAKDKVGAFEDILKNRQLSPEEAAYIGDELVDVPLLRRVGFAVAVSDSVRDVKRYADYVILKNGGKGAVREVCELILNVQGKWDTVTAAYFLG